MRSTHRLAALALLAIGSIGFAPAASAEPDPEQIYQLCAQCHGENGEGIPLALAPSIAGLGEWYVRAQLGLFKSGGRGMNPEDVGGLRMHPMSLTLKTDAELDAAAAYVASLPPQQPPRRVEGGDATRGQQLYVVCAACHGAEAQGNQTMNAPRLAPGSDWYLLSSLQKYKAGIRGGNPKNGNAVMMRGMAAQLVDEQAMKDVVAYIMTLNGSE